MPAGRPTTPLIQALSGLATVQAGSDEARPRLVRTILPDKLTGIVAAQAIARRAVRPREDGPRPGHRALHARQRRRFLWGSDMDGQSWVELERPQQAAQSFIDLIYETGDGYISVAVQQDKEWRALCRALGPARMARGRALPDPWPGASATSMRAWR